MKIRSKMLGYMSIIMVVFIVAIFTVWHNSNVLSALIETSKLSYKLSNSYSDIGESALTFRVKQASLAKSIKLFENTLLDMESSLQEFNDSDGKRYIDNDLQQRWDNINKLWKLSKLNYEKTISLMKKIENGPGSQLFKIKPFMLIVIELQDIAKHEVYKKDYRNLTNLDLAVKDVTSTLEIMEKALSDTRDVIELEVKEKRSISSVITLVIALLAIGVSIILSIVFTGNISKRINIVKQIIHSISQKDLTAELNFNSRDEFQDLGKHLEELKNSFGDFIYSTGDSIETVNEITDTLHDISSNSDKSLNEINDKISNMSNELTTLDGNIEKSTSDMIVMDKEIKVIVENINTQSDAVKDSSDAIDSMITSVTKIAQITDDRQRSTEKLLNSVNQGGVYVENTYDNIKLVDEEITAIKELVEVIKNIADQTNILSMNAAIESAHAGDAGKGFSVVADEIRSLSEYTANNVKEINSAIGSIINRISMTLVESEKSSTTYKEINEDIKDFYRVMSELSTSTNALVRGGEEVAESTMSVSELNQSVRLGAQTLINQSNMIEESMLVIKGNSKEVTNNMKSISRRSNSVLESFSGVNEITIDTKSRIMSLAERMNSFKLKK